MEIAPVVSAVAAVNTDHQPTASAYIGRGPEAVDQVAAGHLHQCISPEEAAQDDAHDRRIDLEFGLDRHRRHTKVRPVDVIDCRRYEAQGYHAPTITCHR